MSFTVNNHFLFVSERHPFFRQGAILCFLAGWDEINVVHDMLLSRISDVRERLL